MSDIVIKVENLSKRYEIGRQRQSGDGLRHRLEDWMNPAKWFKGRNAPGERSTEDFWALKDVSFEIKQGDVVGIIGRNGAGKSTLLKILCRITEPTNGRVKMRGRVASLLEVGTGFHPELTGRENIFLNGAILGMSRVEIKKKFDEIVAFSEVEKFLDTPVKRYSSGMYVRLAFAVAAHLEPEILVVDEVLAVGDAQFQKKCIGKMQDVSDGGRTVLFVSHSITTVRRLCSRAILLGSGKIVAQGAASQILTHYQTVTLPQQGRQDWPNIGGAPGSEVCRIRRIRATDEAGKDIGVVDISSRFLIEIVFDVLVGGHVLVPNFHFYNDEGQCLFVAQDLDSSWRGKPRPAGRHFCRLLIPGNFLTEGRLSIGGAITSFAPFFVHGYAQDVIGIVIEDSCSPQGARGDYVGHLPGVIRPLLESSNEYSDVAAKTNLPNA